jgi:hypothetical protein
MGSMILNGIILLSLVYIAIHQSNKGDVETTRIIISGLFGWVSHSAVSSGVHEVEKRYCEKNEQ